MEGAGDKEVKGDSGSAMDVEVSKEETTASTTKPNGITLTGKREFFDYFL